MWKTYLQIIIILLYHDYVISQTVCLSGAFTTNGFINGEYTRISDYDGYPAYRLVMNGNTDGYGCSDQTVYIYRRNSRYLIHDNIGSSTYNARCRISTNDATECNGNWDNPSFIESTMEVNIGECPYFDCDSINVRTNNGRNNACTGTLNYQSRNKFISNQYQLVWNKNHQEWFCFSGSSNRVDGCTINGIQSSQNNEGWIHGLTPSNDISIQWSTGNTLIIECIKPTISPSESPTIKPSKSPTMKPTVIPTKTPTETPSKMPTLYPTNTPSQFPTYFPSNNPTQTPTLDPTQIPTNIPTSVPTNNPTTIPTLNPTALPTISPTANPTILPSNNPTVAPNIDTKTPTILTDLPTFDPTKSPTFDPTLYPTKLPTNGPSFIPSLSPSSPVTNTTLLSTYILDTYVIYSFGDVNKI